MAKYNQKATVLDELAKLNQSEFDKMADKIAQRLDPIIDKTIRKSVPRLLKQVIRESLNPVQKEKEITHELL